MHSVASARTASNVYDIAQFSARTRAAHGRRVPYSFTVRSGPTPTTRASELDDALLRRQIRAKLFGLEDTPPTIGRFEIRGRLGRGGMGAVYLAYDPRLEREVAIKLLHREHAADRFEREARALARLSHPNVVTVHDFGQLDAEREDPSGSVRWWMALERVEGENLRAWLQRKPGLHEKLRVFHQAALGLVAAHEAGLVHRDIKPENIIVGRKGRVRIVDFGLVGEVDEPALGLQPNAEFTDPRAPLERLTATDQWLGTPGYMAPEQFLGRPADPRSDQFSFCVALFEALFGVSPFAGDTIKARFTAVTGGELRSLPAAPRLSAELRNAIERGLQSHPQARNANMQVIADALAPTADKPSPARWFSLFAVALVAAGLSARAACAAGDASSPPDVSHPANGAVQPGAPVKGEHDTGEDQREPQLTNAPIPDPEAGCDAVQIRPGRKTAEAERRRLFQTRLVRSMDPKDPDFPFLLLKRGVYEAESGDAPTACRTFAQVMSEHRQSDAASRAQCLQRRLCRPKVTCPEGTALVDPTVGCSIDAGTCSAEPIATCQAGELACCARASLLLEFEWLDSKDEPAARRDELGAAFDAVLARLCDAGDAASCWSLSKRGTRDAATLTQRACTLGHPAACKAVSSP